jgi:hypothetical protein
MQQRPFVNVVKITAAGLRTGSICERVWMSLNCFAMTNLDSFSVAGVRCTRRARSRVWAQWRLDEGAPGSPHLAPYCATGN